MTTSYSPLSSGVINWDAFREEKAPVAEKQKAAQDQLLQSPPVSPSLYHKFTSRLDADIVDIETKRQARSVGQQLFEKLVGEDEKVTSRRRKLNGIREWWADHKEAWHDKKKAIERADASIAIILSHSAPEDCMGDWSVLERRIVSPEEESRNRLANSNRQVGYLKRWKESHLQWFRENAVLMDKTWLYYEGIRDDIRGFNLPIRGKIKRIGIEDDFYCLDVKRTQWLHRGAKWWLVMFAEDLDYQASEADKMLKVFQRDIDKMNNKRYYLTKRINNPQRGEELLVPELEDEVWNLDGSLTAHMDTLQLINWTVETNDVLKEVIQTVAEVPVWEEVNEIFLELHRICCYQNRWNCNMEDVWINYCDKELPTSARLDMKVILDPYMGTYSPWTFDDLIPIVQLVLSVMQDMRNKFEGLEKLAVVRQKIHDIYESNKMLMLKPEPEVNENEKGKEEEEDKWEVRTLEKANGILNRQVEYTHPETETQQSSTVRSIFTDFFLEPDISFRFSTARFKNHHTFATFLQTLVDPNSYTFTLPDIEAFLIYCTYHSELFTIQNWDFNLSWRMPLRRHDLEIVPAPDGWELAPWTTYTRIPKRALKLVVPERAAEIDRFLRARGAGLFWDGTVEGDWREVTEDKAVALIQNHWCAPYGEWAGAREGEEPSHWMIEDFLAYSEQRGRFFHFTPDGNLKRIDSGWDLTRHFIPGTFDVWKDYFLIMREAITHEYLQPFFMEAMDRGELRTKDQLHDLVMPWTLPVVRDGVEVGVPITPLKFLLFLRWCSSNNDLFRIYRDNEISVLRNGWPPAEVDDPECLTERPTFTKDTGYYADDVEILG